MKFALVNPSWSFDGSIYFGCRQPHLPLEYGYAQALLRQAGHEAEIFDGQLGGLSREQITSGVAAFGADIAVVTTAPSYLFWRCAPPELRVPQDTVADLRDCVRTIVAVGPHASTTPATTINKLGVDAVVLGECEDLLPLLAAPHDRWPDIASLCLWQEGRAVVHGSPHATAMADLPAPRWPDAAIRAHHHHHHRFDAAPAGPGAEMESSRGCPYHCSFCAKDNFRNGYRKRPLAAMLDEIDGLLAQGVEYVYFIDEIFLPNRELLQALVGRGLKIGVQTRIDLWSHEMLDLLGAAGCVSIEAGVESLTEEGRAALDKNCRMSTDDLAERLLYARRSVPFVQANLIRTEGDDEAMVATWRQKLQHGGVWANDPVPLYPYPSSPDYVRLFGAPDDLAWERAHEYYLAQFTAFSDIQEERPQPLAVLEAVHGR
jgi:anaerobic magnesium-protoporphyrin IX monomethyl ester cyclase